MPKKIEEKKVTRAMPANVEAEQAVLGSILIDNRAADDLIPRLREDDFFVEKHRTILGAMRGLHEKSSPIDTVTVADALEVQGKLDEVGSVAYLSELAESVLSSANGGYYADMLRRDGLIRRVINAGNEIVKAGYDSEEGLAALAEAERLVYQISDENSEKTLVKGETAFAEAMNIIQDAQIGNRPQNIVNTQFAQFDKSTKGLKPGELIILAARPGVGKTAFALNVAVNVALKGKTVAIFSMEMDAPLIAKRMLAYESRVTFDEMDSLGGLKGDASGRLMAAFRRLSEAKIFIDDYRQNTPGDILSKCRRLKREQGLDLVIVDYLQLMKGGASRGYESRQIEVSEMSRMMKIYAGELGVPILTLCQMSRGAVQRKEEPQLSDLRESGSIEQDADVVMFLYNPSSYNDALPENQIQLLIRKNRNGPLKDIWLEWEGETTTFREMPEGANVGGGGAPQYTQQPQKPATPAPATQTVSSAPQDGSDENGASAPTPPPDDSVAPPDEYDAPADEEEYVAPAKSDEPDGGFKAFGDMEDGLSEVREAPAFDGEEYDDFVEDEDEYTDMFGADGEENGGSDDGGLIGY